MTNSEFISIFLLAFIVTLSITLVYRFEKRINQLALSTMHNLSPKSKLIIFNYEKLESISFGWIIGLFIYKYLVGSWLITPSQWVDRQISIGIYLALFFMIFEYILLFYRSSKDKKDAES